MEKITKSGVEIIAEERKKQSEIEGLDTDQQKFSKERGELIYAAITYAIPHEERAYELAPLNIWPWDGKLWQPFPHNRIKELAKAGALIAAEIDRLNRLRGVN